MKTRRQAVILDLINEYPIETQEELMTHLKENGFKVTQATVSRDIKELRLLKSLSADGRYRYTSFKGNPEDAQGGLNSFFNNSVLSVKQAQNLIVIRTLSGMAQAVCATLDNSELVGMVGTIAGDDTIFIACLGTDYASKLAIDLKKLL